MRQLILSVLVLGFGLAPSHAVRAEDPTKAILDKAIKAYGGADKLAKARASDNKGKGTVEAMGVKLKFTQEVQMQLPDKFKSVMQLEVMGQNVSVTSIFDGKNLWINANGMNIAATDKMIAEVREQLHLAEVGRLVTLSDKQYQLSPLGEVKVEGKDAVGILVASKGHKDISLFFDKQTGLLVKVERRAVDAMSGQEFTEESFPSDYHAVDGIQEARHTVVKRDGKEFMVADVTDSKYVDQFDDSTFAKP
jgi:hypothetical protein